MNDELVRIAHDMETRNAFVQGYKCGKLDGPRVLADPSAVAGVFLAAICAVMAGAAYLLWVVLT